MIRTRDFLLGIVCVAFLALLFGSQFLVSAVPDRPGAITPDFVDSEGATQTASFEDSLATTRGERLESMRQKIADSRDVFLIESKLEEQIENDVPISVEPVATALLCPNYQIQTAPTVARYSFSIAEGARVVQAASRSTDATSTTVMREVAVLPLLPTGRGENCLTTNIVGFTLNGEVITNNQAQRFQVYTDSRLIGYALDGHPIYGPTGAVTDNCGGNDLSGQYRYFAGSETVLNCFVSTPSTLSL